MATLVGLTIGPQPACSRRLCQSRSTQLFKPLRYGAQRCSTGVSASSSVPYLVWGLGTRSYSNPHRNVTVQFASSSFLVPDITPTNGVPEHVAEEIMKTAMAMPLYEVALRSIIEIAIVWATAVVCNKIIAWLCSAICKKVDRERVKAAASESHTAANRNVFYTLIESSVFAVQGPATSLLPVLAFVHSARVTALFLQIVVQAKQVGNKKAGLFAKMLINRLSRIDQAMLDASQLALVGFGIWVFLGWKDKLVDLIVQSADLQSGSRRKGSVELARLVTALSGLVTWAVILVGILSSLAVVGVNIQPLLTVGGVSGIAIGFGAQSLTTNIISGLSLMLSRPFVVGDRVELKTLGGGAVVAGVVEKIDPMRTLIRNDLLMSVQIPNKALLDMVVVNESRLERSAAVTNFKDTRQYSSTIGVRFEDLKKVPDIVRDIKDLFERHPGVDKALPYGASLADISNTCVSIQMMAHTTPTQSRVFGAFKSEILAELAAIVEKNGAEFRK